MISGEGGPIIFFEPPGQGGSPQGLGRRQYGGRPKGDERSCREGEIERNPSYLFSVLFTKRKFIDIIHR